MSVSKEFILAGDAIFTIETPKDGHRTYRVTHKPADGQWKEAWLVKSARRLLRRMPRRMPTVGRG